MNMFLVFKNTNFTLVTSQMEVHDVGHWERTWFAFPWRAGFHVWEVYIY